MKTEQPLGISVTAAELEAEANPIFDLVEYDTEIELHDNAFANDWSALLATYTDQSNELLALGQ